MRTIMWLVLSAVCIVVLTAAGLLSVLAMEGRKGPVHHAMSRSFLGNPPQRALDAATVRDWDLAFREARQCVLTMEDEGFRQQARLEAQHAAPPSPYRTTRDEMVSIMRRGTLNSLAQCSLLEGEAAMHLNNSAAALRAYERTGRLTYGRVYDEEAGWFWSPAERADHAIADLKRPANR